MQYSCRGFHGTGSFSDVDGGGDAGKGETGAWARNPEERKGRQDSMRQTEGSPARDGGRSGKARERDRDGMGRKICGFLSALVLVVIVAVCIPMTVPRLLGYEVYVVISGSMEPAIPLGSALYMEAAAPEDVAAGDVIAFYDRGAVITHRVVENHVVEGEFITKGDANAENDMAPVAYGNLIGRMAVSVPFLGNVMAVCSGTKGKIYLVCGVLGAVMLLWLGRLLDKGTGKRRA